MRLKLTIFITKIVLLAAAVLWFFQNPGVVTVEWQGLEVEVSLGVVLLGLLGLFFLYGLVSWLLGRMNHFLQWFYESKATRRRREGRALLSEAFSAQLLGCDLKAIDLAEESQKLLPLSGIPSVVLYQVGKKTDNHTLIKKSLKQLNKFEELKPIVIAEELSQFYHAKAYDKAEKITEKLKKDFPKNPWAWREITLYKYKIQDWKEAHEALHKAEGLGAFQEVEFSELAGKIWYELSQLPNKDRLNTLKLLEKSFEVNPANAKTSVAYAKALVKEGDEKLATSVLKQTWKEHPDWHVAEAYAHILSKKNSAIDHLKYVKEIAETNATHPAAILTLAVGCLKADIYGEAAKYIQQLPDSVDRKILQASLIKAEKKDVDAANRMIKELLEDTGHSQAASVL